MAGEDDKQLKDFQGLPLAELILDPISTECKIRMIEIIPNFFCTFADISHKS